MVRYLTLSFFLLLSLAWVSAQTSWQLTPGDSVGAISLGMSSSQVAAVLTPSREFGPKKSPTLIEYGSEIMVEYEASKAVIISLHQNSFTTKSGVVTWVPYKGAKIGAAWTAVAAQLPANKLERKLPSAKGHPVESYFAYTNLGLGLHVKGGTIVKIDVWQAK